jgi:hypothetical protein
MQVTFTRTGPRRYAIAADRGGGSVVHMPVAPGYDPWLPHDLVHLAVERYFGIAHGVFGQLAAGGTAGTFFAIPHRRRDRAGRRSARLAAIGREDTARSERLAATDTVAWHLRRTGRSPSAGALDDETPSAALLADLDHLARRWNALGVGEALTLTWPADLTPRPGGSAHGRRRSRDRGTAARRR